jgi:hypothetical protein
MKSSKPGRLRDTHSEGKVISLIFIPTQRHHFVSLARINNVALVVDLRMSARGMLAPNRYPELDVNNPGGIKCLVVIKVDKFVAFAAQHSEVVR